MPNRPNTQETQTERADALEVLLAASSMLLDASSEESVLSGILEISSNVLAADAYAVWSEIDAQHNWRAIASLGLSPSYRLEIPASSAAAPPTSIMAVEDIGTVPMLEPFRETYRKEGIRSMLVVPLSRQGQPASGLRPSTITLYWRHPRHFTARDLDYAAALGNLTATALKQRELRDGAQRERQRLAFLADASAALASSLDYEATLQRVAQLAVESIADWCVVYVEENGVANRIITAHADPAMLEQAREYQRRFPEVMSDDRGVGLVLRTGQPEIATEITDEMIAAAAQSPEQLDMLRAMQIHSSILVPLPGHERILGVIRLLAAGSPRFFDADDVQMAEDLARRAAAAIENAQLHRAVLEQQQQLRLSHAAARMGSWQWDLVHQRITWSDEFKLLHGIPLEAQPGFDGGRDLVHPDDRAAVLATLESVLDSDAEQIQMEHRAITPSGRVLWVESRGSIQRDASGKAIGISGVTLDVTESRLAEEALRRTEKLAAAGRLAATVAHEVNNPLEALTNLIYLVSSMDDLPAEAMAHLRVADGELRRLSHVVRQTLGFYRESESAGVVDIGVAAAEMCGLYRSRAEARSIRLHCQADPESLVLANAGEIKQVLANLISNAIDATSHGAIGIVVCRQPDRVDIVVSDTGSGIPEDVRDRLFEPFFTTKAEVGTGLGLWVSRGLIEKHGGTLDLITSTSPGASGTTVTASLPRATREPEETQKAAPAAAITPSHS